MTPKKTVSNQRETDMSKVIQSDDVETNRDLKNYFRQRLGPDFEGLPFVYVDRDAYLRLIHGEHALLSKMIIEDEPAAREIFLAYAGDKLNRVVMTFHIEKSTVGNRAIEFIRKHKTTHEHELWFVEMEELSYKIQKLHRHWKKQPVQYYKLVNEKAGAAFKK